MFYVFFKILFKMDKTKRFFSSANETSKPSPKKQDNQVREDEPKKKRGRKPKPLTQHSPNNSFEQLSSAPKTKESLIKTKKSASKPTPKKQDNQAKEETPKKKRGRKPKSETGEQKKPTKPASKKTIIIDDYQEDEEEESEKEESDSDVEFKIDEDEVDESDDEIDDKNEEEDDDDDIEVIKKGKKFATSVSNSSSSKTYKTRRAIKSNKVLASDQEDEDEEMNESDQPEDDADVLNEFDLNLKVSEWKYELDYDSKAFTKPTLPRLSEAAIKPFISDKSKPPKLIIYECPYCKRAFTYTLVFKNHLYSCDENKNTPDYMLFCAKRPECNYKSKKKQEVINHFVREHTRQGRVDNDDESLNEEEELDDYGYSAKAKKKAKSTTSNNQSPVKLSVTKQNQLEVSRYYYVNKKEFKFSFDYLNEYLAKSYKCLSIVDEFYLRGLDELKYYHFVLKLESNIDQVEIDDSAAIQKLVFKESKNLLFKLDKNDNDIEIKPFEMFNNSKSSNKFKLINVVNQVTCLDWCPVKYADAVQAQYLAFSTLPLEQLNTIYMDTKNKNFNYKANDASKYHLKTLFESANLIYICKFLNLNNEPSEDEDEFEIFSILNKNIGNISCLKW